MEKYELLPLQLQHTGIAEATDFFEPSRACDDEDVLRVHTAGYLQDLKNLALDRRSARKLGFPLSNELVQRELMIAQGTIEGCLKSFDTGVSMNIAGGTHHSYTDHGEAFCLLNDQAIAARYLQAEGLANKILIVDLDVHQGNGTAEIFQGDDSVFTFSMHGAGNYPFKKETSDLDIAVPDGTGDQGYLRLLKDTLPGLLDELQPDFIFYLCGVDVLASDKLGRLSLTPEGCRARDEFFVESILRFRESVNRKIPVQCSMGGGYSPEISVIVDAHAETFRQAHDLLFF
jgi:acetoin utilization deacetylase AcuC-like enzyme